MSCNEQDPGKGPALADPMLWIGLGLAALLTGCSSTPPAPTARPAAPSPKLEPAATESQPARPGVPSHQPSKPGAGTGSPVPKLEPPKAVRTHDELRRQAALRLVAANPERSYMTEVPAVLLAIPVLEIELYSDGRIKRVHVLRRPGQAPDTLQLAIDAVHRAAPFGNVARMPEPWKFTETFLFRDDRRFKPRTLD